MSKQESRKDKQIARFLSMYGILSRGGALNPKELVRDFGVSMRTFERDIVMMQTYFDVKLIKGKDRLWRIERGLHEDGALSFGDIKHFAQTSGIAGLYPRLDDSMIADVISPETSQIYDIKGTPNEEISRLKEMFEELGAAISDHYEISFYYKEKARQAKPYKLVNNDGVWYLLADEGRKIKHFALSKISKLKVLHNEEFSPSKTQLESIENSELKWYNQSSQKAQILILPVARAYFERKKAFGEFKRLSDDERGILIEVKFAFDDELLNLVKAWIPYVKIIEPKPLNAKLKKLLEGYIKSI
ncbi:MAG: WYL domain-containing protein [Campylobacter sp.]|uniref:helix-turn-helix transcriptional regulator n=1 Tax=Campylobacter sp. TaxID=205 RepID=UPI002A80DEED|nr:WYL domain-containing protein [Campylobacter sp.]MCI6340920.1 WYL domain-containing protein [Campylobacter sp.]MDY4445564.1 WYL domain-containing protein [Campylobacter sp.]